MDKILKLYTYEESSTSGIPFPNDDEQIIISNFTYDAGRMSAAPTISATVKHRLCLDDLWNDKVYATFRGEKYFIMNTPSSDKDNTDQRYNHDIQLLSEREVLNHVYFIDAVQGDSTVDVYKSNSTKVTFFGDVNEFVSRLNACLSYNKLGYTAVVDEGVTSEDKQVSFEDKYILEALQEVFNVYEIPYYFVGKVIHVGYTENTITYPFKYGFGEALLSISKQNANYALINKIKGQGSSDNIPYYYPNNSPKGDIGAEAGTNNKGISTEDINIINYEKFSDVELSEVIEYVSMSGTDTSHKYKVTGSDYVEYSPSSNYFTFTGSSDVIYYFQHGFVSTRKGNVSILLSLTVNGSEILDVNNVTSAYIEDGEGMKYETYQFSGRNIIFNNIPSGRFTLYVSIKLGYRGTSSYQFKHNAKFVTRNYWEYNEEECELSDLGLEIDDSVTPSVGDTINQVKLNYITPMSNLMPSIYRESLGAQQFYEAKNNTYEDGEGGYYEFENEYSDTNQRQGTTDFEDIKPTIEGMTNASGQRIDMFSAFAYDTNDNDEVDEEGNYIHSYFFAKLRKFDGENGFNLFDHAIESQAMQISFTSGVCGACTFEIGVGEERQENIVQVDENGDLLRDGEGNVLWRDQKAQDRQNDTRNYEVWIALKKEDSTYGIVFPNATQNLKPSTSDTFVILGINLPTAYITAAEKRLEQSLIKYMWMNNKEKFTFSIKFSRIFFTEHPEVLEQLNENSRVLIEYNGQQHTLYVDNFSYKTDDSSPLPEIEIDLVDTLSVGQNSLQTQLDSVKQDILSSIGGGDFLKQGLKYFLRKDVNDVASGKITFRKGLDSKGDVVIGENGFAGGLAGFGAKISKEGRAEMRSLTLWEFLEVPELRYNSVKVFLGIDWQVAGAGIIESCTPDTDSEGNILSTGTCTLKLEEGQYGAVAVDDIALGIWHFGDSNDATEDTDDGKGGFTFAGFATTYFRITEVSGVNNETFRYSLRPNFKIHPQSQMTFACYGNFTNAERQTSTYRTRTYTRRLWKQNTWEIGVQNIAMQEGDLSNLNIFGMDMKGYSMYINSVYFTGTITQVKPDGTPVMTANDKGAWVNNTKYDYYDRVSHNGCIWLCVNEDGTDTEPSESNPNWLLQVSKGDNGQDGTSFRILGSKDDESQLPTDGNEIGDGYLINGHLWVWNGTEWNDAGVIQGPAGESVVNMGEWYDGLHVPYLGIVRMGNATFMCTVENGTYNPPYYTLLDNSGNRLNTNEGYIITGDINNAEYQLIAADGADGLQGLQGEKGEQGIQGEKGSDGKTSYFHIKYSDNPDGNPMTETPSTYIGTYVDFEESDSDDYTKYAWARFEGIQGEKGEQGIPGYNGVDGKTYYLHIKYSNDGGSTFTGNNGEDSGDYIGVLTDLNPDDSDNPSDYKWSKIKGEQGERGLQGLQGEKGEQGIQGEKGEDGRTSYFHIKYSVNSNGNPMTEVPSTYIGTYVDFEENDSNDYTKYTWSRFEGAQGEKGEQGIAGTNGENGQTSYLHIAYANSEDGSVGFSVSDSTNKLYIGQYTDFEINDSTDYRKYSWTKIKGEQGDKGDKGDGYTNLGAWYSGLLVPYLGVVTMAGSSYVAKVATYNPPLFTLLDNSGNRIKTNSGYILTGEVNTEEYDLLAEKGDTGEKGDKGDKGDSGEQGIDGCIVRDSEWTIGTEYRNDSNIADGSLAVRYIDVALVRNDAVDTGWDAYRCKLTHVASSSITYANTSYWEKFSTNVGSIFTSLIIAKNAKIQFLQGNQLLIQKSDGTITAGISGSENGEKIRIWAGGADPDTAVFRVSESGKLYASDVEIEGSLKSGSVGDFIIDGGIKNLSDNPTAYIQIEKSGGKYFRVNMADGMCSIRNDSATALKLQTYGDSSDSIALDIMANAAGYGYAIKSYGAVLLRARDGECVNLNGLGLNITEIMSNYTVKTNDDIILCSNTSVITVTLTDMMADTRGKIIILKTMGSNVNISGTIIRSGTSVSSYDTYLLPAKSQRIFVSFDVSWIELSC